MTLGKLAGLVPLALSVVLCAQTAPTAYRLVETNAIYGAPETVTIWRSGAKVLVEHAGGAGSAVHARTLYDLDTHKTVNWNWPNPGTACGSGTFSGDWGDPFAGAADMIGTDARLTGIEPLLNRSANVYDAPAPGSDSLKVWIDNKTGLVLKAQLIPQAGDARTILEVTDLSFEAPSPSAFALPPGCAAANAPTPEQQLAALTGGNPQDYADATQGPASADACTVVFKIAHAGTLAPITAGFQLAIDRAVDPAHPVHYTLGATPDGHVEFGGGLHEVTGDLRDGALHIDNAPAQFELDAEFGNAGSANALVYRQCFAPQTVLLFVVKDPAHLAQGGQWLWVKAGKTAR